MLYICLMTQQDRLQKRNQTIRKDYRQLSEKHPQWRYDALIDDVADRYFLAPRTIKAILSREGNY